MDVRSIKTIEDRQMLDALAVKARTDREVKRQYGLSQLELDILLIIGACSSFHRVELISVPYLVFFLGYSESNSGRVYDSVKRLAASEMNMLEKHEGPTTHYSMMYHGLKVVRKHLELAKIFKEDVKVQMYGIREWDCQ